MSPRAYLTPLGLYNAFNGHYATSFIGKIETVITWAPDLLWLRSKPFQKAGNVYYNSKGF